MLALHLGYSTAALTTHQKFLTIWELAKLKMLYFSDLKRTDIAICVTS